MNKAVFLDRDGTINIDKHYLHRWEDFEYLEGAVEGLKLLSDMGYLLIIITNQSGIGRGYFEESDYKQLEKQLSDDLVNRGVNISEFYYCPHLPDALVEKYRIECDCRKPGLGLFHKAVKKYDIDLSKSYAIGDRVRDLNICKENGAKGFLLYNSDEVIPDGVNAKRIAGGILQAAQEISKEDL